MQVMIRRNEKMYEVVEVENDEKVIFSSNDYNDARLYYRKVVKLGNGFGGWTPDFIIPR